MKTIFVVFGDLLTANCYNNLGAKRYCFRTESDVKAGDVLKSPDYDTPMTVVNVLDKDFQYFNKVTGELSSELTSTCSYPIKTIEVVECKSDVVYATKMNDE